jgi:signal transduction histidine kinase
VAVRAVVDEPLPPVQGDPDKIRQVLVNLMLNAAQAMAGEGELTLALSLENQRVVLQVEDSGPGIPDELRERIFDPFFSTKGAGEGTGLGLSVCRRLMDDHGGDISVGKSPAGGACIRLAFPRAEVEKCFDNCRDDS